MAEVTDQAAADCGAMIIVFAVVRTLIVVMMVGSLPFLGVEVRVVNQDRSDHQDSPSGGDTQVPGSWAFEIIAILLRIAEY